MSDRGALVEEMMRKTSIVIGFIACMFTEVLHAAAEQGLKGAYRPATVVSVQRVDTTVNYDYDIGIRVDCILYVARYKSATDYVPVEIAPNHAVDILVDEHGHWMHVFLWDRPMELRLTSTKVLAPLLLAEVGISAALHGRS
jgi:hypothetical protein